MTRIVRSFAIGLCLLGPVTAAHADDVANTAADPRNFGDAPHSGLKLGHGVSPGNVSVATKPCIVFQEEHIDPDVGAMASTISVSYVRDQQQLQSALNIDVKAQASGWGASADFGLSKSISSKYSSDSAVLLVTASSDFGRWALKPVPKAELTAEYQALLSDPRKFEDQCGSRYVNMEWRSASVTAIITISNISSDLRDAIKIDFGVSGSYGAVSGSLKAAFASELKKAATQTRVTSTVYAKGGMGVSGLGDLVTASISGTDPLGEVAKTLAAYIKNINASNAFPVAFQVRSMSDFGWRPEAMLLWDDDQERLTRLLFNAASLVEADRAELQSMVDAQSPWLGYAETNGFGSGIASKELFQLTQAAKYLRSTYQICIEYKSGMADCDPTHITRYRSRIVAMAEATPRTSFGVVKSLPEGPPLSLSADAARVVLSAPVGQRDTIAARFDPKFDPAISPEASGIIAAMRFSGDGLVSQQIIFISEDGSSNEVYSESAAQQETWYNANGLTPDPSLEAGVKRFMASWNGSHVGTFAVRLRDISGRVTIAPFADANWDSANGILTHLNDWKIVAS